MTTDDAIRSKMTLIRERMFREFPNIDTVIERRMTDILDRWAEYIRNDMAHNNPFIPDRRRLVRAEIDRKANDSTIDSIMDDLMNISSLAPEESTQFWKDECKKNSRKRKNRQSHLDSIRRNEQEFWRRSYDRKLNEWQIGKVEMDSADVLERMSQWIMNIFNVRESLEDLGIDQEFLDMGVETLSAQDIDSMKEWADRLKNDENIMRIVQLLGKMEANMESPEEEVTRLREYEVTVPDDTVREDIVGIVAGNSTADIIPRELSLLDVESVLFDAKFIENKLMCFERKGNLYSKEKRLIEETVIERGKRGPIIICIDTSGSMAGTPENIAKAVTLNLASKAITEGRNCFLINFGTETRTTDLAPPKGIADLVDVLRESFHGDTDIRPALKDAITALNDDAYRKADVLVISDFLIADMRNMPDMNECRRNGTRFFSLAIGSFKGQSSITDLFDNNWTYEPNDDAMQEHDPNGSEMGMIGT